MNVDGVVPNLSKRQRYLQRSGQLDTERQSWDVTLKDIRDFLEPYGAQFMADESGRGDRRDQNIINCEPSLDVDTQAAGCQAGITSPTRPWQRVSTPYAQLNELKPVKAWTAEVTELMLQTYAKSNMYDTLHSFYKDIIPFGTAVMHVDEDADEVVRGQIFPCGTYSLANNAKRRVDTCYRRVRMTVRQLVDEFGFKKTPTGPGVSEQVRLLYNSRQYDKGLDVLHAQQPNGEMEYERIGPRGMAFSSCWLELGGGEAAGFLREAGYNEQAFFAGRWSVVGTDAYGRGPGHRALGDIKALQRLERRKLQGVDKAIDPPMVLPESYRDLQASLTPGSQIYSDGMRPNEGARPALIIDPRAILAVDQVIQQHLRRIAKAMHADLWMVLGQVEAGKMTATEATLRRNEAMVQLGPMLERFFNEVLRPLNRRIFSAMMRRGLLPPPPQELLGVELREEFISILAQAQKATGIQALRETTSFVLELATAQVQMQQPPTALDKLDVDQAIDEYNEMVGAAPSIVRSDDEVQALRKQRAKDQQQQAAMQQMQVGAKTAKDLAAADTQGDNALTRLMDAMGVNKPAA